MGETLFESEVGANKPAQPETPVESTGLIASVLNRHILAREELPQTLRSVLLLSLWPMFVHSFLKFGF